MRLAWEVLWIQTLADKRIPSSLWMASDAEGGYYGAPSHTDRRSCLGRTYNYPTGRSSTTGPGLERQDCCTWLFLDSDISSCAANCPHLEELEVCTHVLVKNDITRRPLRRQYEGLYKVFERTSTRSVWTSVASLRLHH